MQMRRFGAGGPLLSVPGLCCMRMTPMRGIDPVGDDTEGAAAMRAARRSMSSRGRVPETLGALEVALTDADLAARGEAIAGEPCGGGPRPDRVVEPRPDPGTPGPADPKKPSRNVRPKG